MKKMLFTLIHEVERHWFYVLVALVGFWEAWGPRVYGHRIPSVFIVVACALLLAKFRKVQFTESVNRTLPHLVVLIILCALLTIILMAYGSWLTKTG